MNLYPRFPIPMQTTNYWILAPFIIFFGLVAVPIAYIWISHYYAKLSGSASKLPATLGKGDDIESQAQSDEELIPERVSN